MRPCRCKGTDGQSVTEGWIHSLDPVGVEGLQTDDLIKSNLWGGAATK